MSQKEELAKLLFNIVLFLMIVIVIQIIGGMTLVDCKIKMVVCGLTVIVYIFECAIFHWLDKINTELEKNKN